MNRGKKYKYDVAVSYESHSRNLVVKVVNFLRGEGWDVFLDVERQHEMLSENLQSSLYQIYQNESLIKVLFVTEEYLKNEYTLLEARRSFDSTRGNRRRLIVVNFMEEIPEPYKDYVYLKDNLYADEIASFIGQRIRELKSAEEEAVENLPRSEAFCEKTSQKNVNIIGNNYGGIIMGNHANVGDVYLR